MAFNKEDFTRVELPKPPSINEVTFNKDGKITLSKGLSGEFSLSNIIGNLNAGNDATGDVGANIYAKKTMVDKKKKDAEGKMQTYKKEQVVGLYVEFVPYADDVDCTCNMIANGKLRVNAKKHMEYLDAKVASKKFGNNAITVIKSDITDKEGDWGIVIDLTKRPLPKRKTKPKSKTTVSAPGGEQATPKTQQKSTKIVQSPTGALQME